MIPQKPADAFWSDEQWQAIYESGNNILVNAGAGSGKTAVLTERILQILKRRVGIGNLIVLTFTKAAAAEMKERLRAKLEAEIAKGENFLREDLERLDSAAIQTFDSFALSLVRRYHYLLGVSHSIQIGDSMMFSIRKSEIAEEVFTELYEEEDPGFYKLVSLFSVKNDTQLKNYILAIDEKLDLLPDKREFLNSYQGYYYRDEFIEAKIREFTGLLDLEKQRVRMRLKTLKEEISDEVLSEHIYQCEEALGELLAAKTYEDYVKIKSISLPRIPRYTENPDQKSRVEFEKKQIKDILDRLKGILVYQDSEEMKAEIRSTEEYTKTMVKILLRIDEKFMTYKKQLNCFEFADIARFAIALVKDHEDVRNAVAESAHEILIDEYQDTSDIQEILISYITRNNVYMVGDMKQSIYRFRNANPNIFKNKYQDFTENHQGIAIDLSKNFRSRAEVLDTVNLVFSQVMSSEIGGVDYNESHRLVLGNKAYPMSDVSDFRPEVLTYNYEEHVLNKHEIEAFIVADDIRMKVKNGYQIYDQKKKVLRPAVYGDFTILAAEKGQFDLYKKIFESLQIPLIIYKDEDFVKSSEIYAVKNLLRLVYCYYDIDYAKDNFRDSALSVLRSFAVEADDSIIHEALSENSMDAINHLFPEVSQRLKKIAGIIGKSTAGEILSQIYQEFHIFEKLVRLGDVEQRENRLNYLYQKFSEFDRIGLSILDAVSYLDSVREENLDIEYPQTQSSDENTVSMMSIHRSKGLEFPICYFPELDHRFNVSDMNERVLFDKDYGIILPVYKEGLKDTFYKTLLKQKYCAEEISERIRLFYVALTRAREKLILVCPKFGTCFKNDLSLVPVADRLNYRSLYMIAESIQYSLSDYTKEKLVNSYTRDYLKVEPIAKLTFSESGKIHHHQISLHKTEESTVAASAAVRGLLSKEKLANIELGTLIHGYLETIDFSKDSDSQIAQLPCTESVKKKLHRFFQNLGSLDLSIRKTYHEYEFIFPRSGQTAHGIIDLILETDSELVIIDYKLNNLVKEEYTEQLTLYKEYLESVSEKKVKAYLYSIVKEEFQFAV